MALLHGYWGAAVVAAASACLIVTGLIGIDFGQHWDEQLQLVHVNQTIESGRFLPTSYNYPQFSYWLSLVGSLPDVASSMVVSYDEFVIRTRVIFLLVSATGGAWLYLALRTRAGELGAAFGSATYLLSFQLAYHARWIAPDTIMAAMTALFLWWLVRAWDDPDSLAKSLLLGVGVALAASAKYQGAILLLPVIILHICCWHRDPSSLRKRIQSLLLTIGVAVTTWLVINPGALIEYGTFRQNVDQVRWVYSHGHSRFQGVASYDLHDSPTYLWRVGKYLLLTVPSEWQVLSIIVVGLVVLGLARSVRREPWLAAALVSPVIVLALYFSTLVVFIARNFLILLPFLAFFAGLGVGCVRERLRGKVSIAILTTGLTLVMLANAYWLVHASRTVGQDLDETLGDTVSYLEQNPGRSFSVSTTLAVEIHNAGLNLPSNVVGEAERSMVDEHLMLFSEISQADDLTLRQWSASEDDMYRTIGPLEVDFDFYPTWSGDDRVLIFTPEQAAARGLGPLVDGN